jgi:tRNA 2-thiouridine synthesizing protein A
VKGAEIASFVTVVAHTTVTAMASGQVLRVLSTDPGSVKDFDAFARQTGNELLDSVEKDKVFEFYLKRK